jgi:hypothetical protein
MNAQVNATRTNAGTRNWFVPGNWSTDAVPTATDTASFEVGGTAQVQEPGAMASALSLLPGTGNPAEVLVNGTGATLNVDGQILLEPSTGTKSTLQIQNGGSVTAQTIDVEAGGQLNIGAGASGGTLSVSSITNSGAINFNLTDTTTINANISGTAGTITKEGAGIAVLNGGVAGSSIAISGGTLALGNISTLAAPVTASGPSSVLQIVGGTSNASSITVQQGGTLDNAGTLGGGTVLNLGPGTANVINRNTGNLTGTDGTGLNFTGGGTVQNFGFIGASQDSDLPGVTVSGGPGTIFNSGMITGSIGVTLNDGGSITNTASGSIKVIVEQAIIAQGAPVTLVNSGTISGTVGVVLSNGGSVTNNAAGTISGTDTGIAADQVTTVVNSGTISGNLGIGIFNGGSITNNAGGTISGFTAIELYNGGSMTNNAGGSIISPAGNAAVVSTGGPLAFSNAGRISGSVTLGGLRNPQYKKPV